MTVRRSAPRGTDRLTRAVATTVERVFRTVADVRSVVTTALDGDAAQSSETAVRDAVAGLLRRPAEIAVGLGLVAGPGGEPPSWRGPRVAWWQVDNGGEARPLRPDFKPTSAGFYDYTVTPWFDTPRSTGRRFVCGPYVDVHGTGRYVLTLTEPLWHSGQFVGVVGADVPVTAFEDAVLREVGRARAPFVLLNQERRVVLSATTHWLVGRLVPDDELPEPGVEVPGVPWTVHLTDLR
ncbi:MAG: cache domain-containing protein [Phycicoccus sp.]